MSSSILQIQRALISVSDKSGLITLADALSNAGIEILSTGGTSRELKKLVLMFGMYLKKLVSQRLWMAALKHFILISTEVYWQNVIQKLI